jgi:hypothetical protein
MTIRPAAVSAGRAAKIEHRFPFRASTIADTAAMPLQFGVAAIRLPIGQWIGYSLWVPANNGTARRISAKPGNSFERLAPRDFR